MSDHYVTAMTESARGYMLLACRCGDIVPATPHEADAEFKTHLTTALVRERVAQSETVVEEPERLMTINDIAEKFFGIKDFTTRTPFDKGVSK